MPSSQFAPRRGDKWSGANEREGRGGADADEGRWGMQIMRAKIAEAALGESEGERERGAERRIEAKRVHAGGKDRGQVRVG